MMAGAMSSSQCSEVSAGDGGGGFDPGFVEQEEISMSSLDLMGSQLMSSEWTDEKHSMYLKSMEASFVDQLYHSMDLNGRNSLKKYNVSRMRASKPTEPHSRNQFKVQQNGSWQRMNFCKGEPPPQQTEERDFLNQMHWIQHFKAAGLQDQAMQGNTSSSSGRQHLGNGGRTGFTCGLANIAQPYHSCQAHQPSGMREEYSDQNFDDNEKGSNRSAHKRTKTVDSISLSNDQVVPFGRSLSSEVA